jgi:predicted RNA-binding Zn-ribbon protein involved in translation (DUF1610 family)
MGFTVEHQCPQCGAPVALDETDRLLRCAYCNTESFLYSLDYFRFALPHNVFDKQIIYAPYLRFRGSVYSCQGSAVDYRVVDITHVGLKFAGLPMSLGLRPQAMKMKFVTRDVGGSFLGFVLRATDIILKASKSGSGASTEQIYHRAYIGETLSIIYLPLYFRGNAIFDAVLNRSVGRLPRKLDVSDLKMVNNPVGNLLFIPTICPQCGWNLKGEKDSVVLLCGNCGTAWEAVGGKFKQVDVWTVPGKKGETSYLPFWKTSAFVRGVAIDSFADFIRVTKQPLAIQKNWEQQGMCFWCPAFKIRPKIFLRIIKQLTLAQSDFRATPGMPEDKLYAATLPQIEAAQTIKITLGVSSVNRRALFSRLPAASFTIKAVSLVYLPFTETRHDMVQQHVNISFNRQSLCFGRYL